MAAIKKFIFLPAEADAVGIYLRKWEEMVAGLSEKEKKTLQDLLTATKKGEQAAITEKMLEEQKRMQEVVRSLKQGGTLDENAQIAVRALTGRSLSPPGKRPKPAPGDVPPKPAKKTQGSRAAITSGPLGMVKMAFCKSKLLEESAVLLDKHFGVKLEEYFDRIYPFFRELEAKPTAAREAGQRITRDGYFFEFLLPGSKKVRTAEDNVLADTIVEVLGGGKNSGEAASMAKEITARMENDVWRRLEFYPAAPDVLAISLTVVRDEGGKLVTDRLRGVLDFKKSEFTVAVIGESKLGQGNRQIIQQLMDDIPRLMSGVSSDILAVYNVKVKFGRKLLLIAQTERPIPDAHTFSVRQKVRAATGIADVGVNLIRVEDTEGAIAARKIIKATYDVIRELSKPK